MKRLAVYCGSNNGTDPAYREAALALAQAMTQHHLDLVYGGSDIGLMGAISQAILQQQGHVIGVMPQIFFDRGIEAPNLTELIKVRDMSERKAKMINLADGFVVLPGGFGTFEEFYQTISWSQLGLHQKPIAVLNINGFFDSMFGMIDQMIKGGFVPAENRSLVINAKSVAAVFQGFANFKYTQANKYQN